LATIDAQNCELDVIADYDGFADISGKDEHSFLRSMELAHIVAAGRVISKEVPSISAFASTTNLVSSSGFLVLVVRPPFVVEDGQQCIAISRIWVQPRINVFWLDVDDGPIMSGRSNLRLRFVCDGGE
jgi:hypothetical protein